MKKEKPELIRTKKLEAASELQQKRVVKLAEKKQKRAESRIQEVESEKLKNAKEMRFERQKKLDANIKKEEKQSRRAIGVAYRVSIEARSTTGICNS